ncbi:MAG: D-glycerate dehydrogenase [Candidatus Heimdallarchaeum endolithica]|uniref:D-glycerate dehydrogenase n=1 Tax=Candidatus Heimdallarchaeum endolithica TaxID=2876572 RepID=A0A9Y1BS20_9ARCH|nr:MAG: D-glycerate dehydrogenase [Candidatus Heimdallarchaeum endolithica]
MKIFVTRKIPREGIELLLKNGFEVEVFEKNEPISREELLSRAKGADGLICLLTDKIDKEIIEKTGIKAISNYAVGYDNIDIQAATELKIPVTNTPGVLTDATADLTWALILAVSRRIVEADKFVREQRFKGWGPMLFLGGDFKNKTIGIIGMGRIGEAVARRAIGFGMKIIYFNRTRKKDLEKELNAKFVSLDTLLKESDYISIHCPYTSETHHLIDWEEFELMKHSTYLINTARGKVVNEKALIKVLQDKRIMGAGLDVFYNEPEVPKAFYSLPNVVILPHIGSASIETRNKMAVMAAENMIECLKGNIPPNIINKEIYGK